VATHNASDKLDGDRYAKITNEIQGNASAHPLTRARGGKFNDSDVEQYIVNFEDIGYLVQENVIVAQMAYNHFSYDVEKAWCNTDVRRIVQAARKADKSITATSDPLFGNLENLATNYLRKEQQICKNLD
jgi:hypothetical protein